MGNSASAPLPAGRQRRDTLLINLKVNKNRKSASPFGLKIPFFNFAPMNDINLQIPAKMDLDPQDTVKFLSAKLFESGRLSLGEAAELSGLSKVEFAETIGEYDVALGKN